MDKKTTVERYFGDIIITTETDDVVESEQYRYGSGIFSRAVTVMQPGLFEMAVMGLEWVVLSPVTCELADLGGLIAGQPGTIGDLFGAFAPQILTYLGCRAYEVYESVGKPDESSSIISGLNFLTLQKPNMLVQEKTLVKKEILYK